MDHAKSIIGYILDPDFNLDQQVCWPLILFGIFLYLTGYFSPKIQAKLKTETPSSYPAMIMAALAVGGIFYMNRQVEWLESYLMFVFKLMGGMLLGVGVRKIIIPSTWLGGGVLFAPAFLLQPGKSFGLSGNYWLAVLAAYAISIFGAFDLGKSEDDKGAATNFIALGLLVACAGAILFVPDGDSTQMYYKATYVVGFFLGLLAK